MVRAASQSLRVRPDGRGGVPRRTGTVVIGTGRDTTIGGHGNQTVLTYITENPWPVGLVSAVFLLIFAILFMRDGESRMLVLGIVCLVCLAGVFLVDAVVVTPAERGQQLVRGLVEDAESGRVDAILERIAPDASLHLGDVRRPGRAFAELERSLRTLERGNRITDNWVTRLRGETRSPGRADVSLACITTTSDSMGSVPTSWLFEVSERPDGTWMVTRVVFETLMGKPPSNPF